MAFFDLTNPLYTSRNFDFTTQDAAPVSFCYTSNGLNMYMVGNNNETVYRYTLTSPFDLSSATYATDSYDFSAQSNTADVQCVRCSGDGDILFITVGNKDVAGNPTLYRYSLTIANDLSAVTYLGATGFFGDKTAIQGDHGFDISPDGNHMIFAKTGSQTVGWEDDSLAHVQMTNYVPDQSQWTGCEQPATQTLSGSPMIDPRGCKYIDSGNRLFVCGDTGLRATKFNDVPYYYSAYLPDGGTVSTDASASWDISEITEISTSIADLWVSTLGTAMQLLGDNGTAYEYNLTQGEAGAFDITQMAFVRDLSASLDSSGLPTQTNLYGVSMSTDGLHGLITTTYNTNASYRYRIWEMEFSTAFDWTTISYTGRSIYLNSPTSAQYTDDGFGMFVADGAFQYNPLYYVLSTAYDLSSNDGGSIYYSGAAYRSWKVIDNGSKIAITNTSGAVSILDLSSNGDPRTGTGSRSYSAGAYDWDHLFTGSILQFGLSLTSTGVFNQWQFDDYWTDPAVVYTVNSEDLSPYSGLTYYSFWLSPNKTQLILMSNGGALLEFSFPDFSTPTGLDGVYLQSDNPIDLGLLVTNVTSDLIFWNNSSLDNEVISITGPLAEVVLSSISVGTIIPAGLELSATITVPYDIAGGVDLSFVISFDNSAPVNFSVDYYKPVLWSFEPNWASRVRQTYEWATAVSVAIDKSEHRRKLRTIPRVTLSLSHLISNQVKERLVNRLSYATDNSFAVPLWPYIKPLTSPLASGASVVNVDNSRSIFQQGKLVCFFNGSIASELFEVDTVTSTTVTLVGVTTQAYNQGCSLIPAAIFNLEGNLDYKTITDKIGELEVSFTSADNTWLYAGTDPVVESYQPTALPAAAPVFDLQTYNSSTPALSVEAPRHSFEGALTTTPDIEFLHEFQNIAEQVSWNIYTAAKVDEFMEWLSHISGSYEDFWYIPERSDMVVISDILANTTLDAIVISDSDFSFYYDSTKHGNVDIAIETYQRDGLDRYYYRSIENIVYDSVTDTSELTIDSVIDATTDLVVSNIKRVTIMRFTRLSSDKVSIDWVGPELIQVSLGFFVKRY